MSTSLFERVFPSADDLIRFGAQLGVLLPPGTQLGLVGEIGAGKTTLTRGIAQGLGVDAPIASPTFAIVEDHGTLVHVDWYRVAQEVELDAIDFDAYLDSGAVVVVEWAERFPSRLDSTALWIKITEVPEGRSVICSGSTDWLPVLQQLESA